MPEATQEGAAPESIHQLPVDQVKPDPDQPRRSFDDKKMAGLVESVKSNGILQPITVMETGPADWQIIYGHRRHEAAKRAGLPTVPAIVVAKGEGLQLEALQLVENIEREELADIDVAHFLHRLRTEKKASTNELAKALADAGLGQFNPKAIDRWVSLVELPEWAQKMMRDGVLDRSAALGILPANQNARWLRGVKRDLTERQRMSGTVTQANVQQTVRWVLRDIGIDLRAKYGDHVRKFPLQSCSNCECLVKLGQERFCLSKKNFEKKNKEAIALEEQKAKDAAPATQTIRNTTIDPTAVEPRDLSTVSNANGVVDLGAAALGSNTWQHLSVAKFDTKVCRGCPHKRQGSYSTLGKVKGNPVCFFRPCFEAKNSAARREELAADKVGAWLDGWLRLRAVDWAIVGLSPGQAYALTYWLAVGCPGSDTWHQAESHRDRSRVTRHEYAIVDYQRALSYGQDASQDGAREEGIIRLAIAMMTRSQLRFFVRHELGVDLAAEQWGFAIDAPYLALQKKAQLMKLAEAGGLENTKGKVDDLRGRILEEPGVVERIGVPDDVAKVFAEDPERGSWSVATAEVIYYDDVDSTVRKRIELGSALSAAALKTAKAGVPK